MSSEIYTSSGSDGAMSSRGSVEITESGASDWEASRKIGRGPFALRLLAICVAYGVLFGLVLLASKYSTFFPFTLLAWTACAVSAIGVAYSLLRYAAAPRMRDIRFDGVSLWMAILVIVLLGSLLDPSFPVSVWIIVASAPSGFMEKKVAPFEVATDLSAMKKHWMHTWPKHMWILFFVAISPAAFLIHHDVSTQYPWVRAYTDWLTQGIPMIGRAAHLHPHPEKFKAFFAYAWSWLPLALLWGLCKRQPILKTLERMKREVPVGIAVLTAMAALVVWVIAVAPGSSVFDLGVIPRGAARARLYDSDLSIALSGPFQLLGTAICLVGLGGVLNMIRTEVYSIKTPGQEN